MNNILGVSAGFHDAAVTLLSAQGDILFAAHSERYSKIKNDANLDPELLAEIDAGSVKTVGWYERPWMHNVQQWRSGQGQYGPWFARTAVRRHLGDWYDQFARPYSRWIETEIDLSDVRAYAHHLSHAAAGFQTSGFDQAAVVVIDAIGELDTVSIYRAWYDRQGRARYKRLWRQSYPHSIGLFYSAVTKAVGLKPMEEEYITMGMAAYGSRMGTASLLNQVVRDPEEIKFYKNLHIGFDEDETKDFGNKDFAAAAQGVTERLIMNVMRRARRLTGSSNLVYMGGVALNCVANAALGSVFDHIWIMPNPGDAGSSLGAAALAYGGRVQWQDAYLGHNIPGPYPVDQLLQRLLTDRIVGVASGRAEWGPRALGNRSLLADPRGSDVKDRVNLIKRRQQFRPFAPVILAERVHEFFHMPRGWDRSDYMQITADCRRPELFPAICHVDGTSRVQTVPVNSRSGIRQLLEAWQARTGCPMLLNTSLNIRGEPMVNDRADADRFEQLYGVMVCS